MHALVIEDNQMVAELVAAAFENAGWHVRAATTAASGLELIARNSFDVVILDIELPDGDGFALLGRMRAQGVQTPVVMLTARGGPDAVIKGLGAGADDYVAKPFNTEELVARTAAVVRRTQRPQDVLEFGDISFNRLTREASCAGRRVRLTPKEQTLLEELMLNRDRPAARAHLLSKVWRIHFDPGSNLLDAHVTRLRSKLKAAGSRVLIVARRAEGYALELPAPSQESSS